MIKISVILPVYNEENYLEQCLDSICNQTLKEIEIICIDDGSTDNSLMILHEYEKLDYRIKILTQENLYAGTARNHGMQYATGKYLLFLDSDDFFQLDMLEKMYQRAEHNQLDITICHYDLYNDMNHEKIDIDFSRKDSFFPKDRDAFSGKDMNYAGIFQATIGWAWDKLFCTDFVKKCGYKFPEFRSSEDGFFVYMLMARADRIGVIQERLVFHRKFNLDSLSNTKEQNWENGFRMLELIREELIRQNLYNLYEQSFVSNAVEFQVGYLKSMFQKVAFYNCFRYIREKTEPTFCLMSYPGEYLCTSEVLEQYRRILEEEPEDFLFFMLREKEKQIMGIRKKRWIFPYHLVPKGCRLILYGAGTIGKEYFDQLTKTDYCCEVRWVDQKYQEYKEQEIPVESPAIISKADFDYVFIAIRNSSVQKKVSQWLQEIGVEKPKIICMGQE